MNTSESCAVVRSFSPSSVLGPKLLLSSEKSRNVEKIFFNFNIEVPTFCSEKSEISFSPEIPNQCISKDISVNNSEEPSNIISVGKYDNCNQYKLFREVCQDCTKFLFCFYFKSWLIGKS